MRLFLSLLLAVPPAPVLAQASEDREHRLDREHTRDLNDEVRRAIARRDVTDAAKLARYRDAEAAYQRERANWRRRVAACEDGDRGACDPG